jgi:hypothetical protein
MQVDFSGAFRQVLCRDTNRRVAARQIGLTSGGKRCFNCVVEIPVSARPRGRRYKALRSSPRPLWQGRPISSIPGGHLESAGPIMAWTRSLALPSGHFLTLRCGWRAVPDRPPCRLWSVARMPWCIAAECLCAFMFDGVSRLSVHPQLVAILTALMKPSPGRSIRKSAPPEGRPQFSD